MSYTPRPKKYTKKNPLSVDVKRTYQFLLFSFLSMGLVSLSLFMYTNSLKPAKGYTLKQLQLNYEQLSSESRGLDHKVIEAKSLIHLEVNENLEEMEVINKSEIMYADSDFGYAYNENQQSTTNN